MDAEKAINEILNDLEHQPLQKSRTFMAYLNAPELVSLSSTNATPQSNPISSQTDNSYFNFQVNLPRPAINVKSLQLLKAIIPQAQTSIPDYSLVFPYYKLRCVPIDNEGHIFFVDEPNYDSLYFVRLLPSNYKQELIGGVQNQYGLNQTFNDYEELSVQLAKACQNDLTFDDESLAKYLPNDVNIFYDSTDNKFKFEGLNVDTLNDYPLWTDAIEDYVVGEVVEFLVGEEYITYLCIQDTLGSDNPPPNVGEDYWLNVSQYSPQIANIYLIAGYNDPNVKELLESVQLGSTLADNIYKSIPGNQYVAGQTLARRLGFTWDGQGMITNNINNYLTIPIQYGATAALFYNRLRPAPLYSTVTPSLLGGNTNPFQYTADGYCNLVYSSIINIYTTIIGTSSVDTQRNANLLGTIEMACGNLGIAFGNNYIDTKLTKIQTDIYSIYIELRDENGQPYYLTNNATSTFLLKLTYLE